ncbi:MAG: RNA polymerase [Rhodobacteraceae bacterium]|nr:RNA polymerase [Paracoccaceae bacterium]
MSAAPQAIAATNAIEAVMRNDRGRLMAALIKQLRDWQLAEEVLQEATISALSHWGRVGLPASPQGWLLKVALRKAIDHMRSGAREAKKAAAIAVLAKEEAEDVETALIPDERLSLIFTCCHPALEQKSQVALTLRTVCGLTTTDIARSFLFRVPGPEEWDARLQAVLTVVYLIYNAGYTAGPVSGRDLCEEAVYLLRIIDRLRPNEPEVQGCLALMMFSHARRAARIGPDGQTVPPQEQDRSLWDQAMLAEADQIVRAALAQHRPGPYQLKAAIAACHVLPEKPDWAQIVALYGVLMAHEPTDIIRLNQAVAMAEAGDLATARKVLSTLRATLAEYQPFHAADAAIAAMAGEKTAATQAYDRAIAMAANPADAVFLTARRDRLH